MFACKCNKNLFKLKSVTNIYLNIDQNIFAMILFIKDEDFKYVDKISFNNIYVALFKDTKCFTSNKTRN